jgi:hypothetical protein
VRDQIGHSSIRVTFDTYWQLFAAWRDRQRSPSRTRAQLWTGRGSRGWW